MDCGREIRGNVPRTQFEYEEDSRRRLQINTIPQDWQRSGISRFESNPKVAWHAGHFPIAPSTTPVTKDSTNTAAIASLRLFGARGQANKASSSARLPHAIPRDALRIARHTRSLRRSASGSRRSLAEPEPVASEMSVTLEW
jgi:hypothetical protein